MISKLAHVDPTARLGENVKIHPFAFIDANVEIGDNSEIMPYTSVISGTVIGRNTKIYSGSVIGADPQDFRWKGEETHLYIGDNVIIREQVIINRGIRPEGGTRIGSGAYIMAHAHIGHDTVVKGTCVIGNAVAIAGEAVIGECTVLSSGVIVHERSKIGDWVLIKGGCRIGSNVPPYTIFAHNPVEFFGVNATIMRKKGFTNEEVDIAARSYRHLYQTQTSVFNAIKRIEADIEDCPIRRNIIDFIHDAGNKLVAIPADLNG